jgi:hypothetical protein
VEVLFSLPVSFFHHFQEFFELTVGDAADNENSIEAARRRRWHSLTLISSNLKQEK